ncbi:hypothetical protein ALC60_00540 [Trachymyrmex zeteki]|uniref:Uncharacterized protein n=1 Tax=Mycetomoellerius zeteki TaxID=64791 RepID=A0A151XIA0_9HYME|nr:hypothetical protein ALC60_00540 [Trachymyrmex zeteki]
MRVYPLTPSCLCLCWGPLKIITFSARCAANAAMRKKRFNLRKQIVSFLRDSRESRDRQLRAAIKAASPVVREEQNSADSSTSCILVRHLQHLEHDSSSSEVAFHFFLVCTLEYFIVHLTFVRGDARRATEHPKKSQLNDGHLSPRHVQEERKSIRVLATNTGLVVAGSPEYLYHRQFVVDRNPWRERGLRNKSISLNKKGPRHVDGERRQHVPVKHRRSPRRAVTRLAINGGKPSSQHGRPVGLTRSFAKPRRLTSKRACRTCRHLDGLSNTVDSTPDHLPFTTTFPMVLGKHFSEQHRPNRYHHDEGKGGVIVSSRS